MFKCNKCTGYKTAKKNPCNGDCRRTRIIVKKKIEKIEKKKTEGDNKDYLVNFLNEVEEKRKQRDKMQMEVFDITYIRMHSGIFPRDANGYSAEAQKYCETVIRIIQEHVKGNKNMKDVVDILNKRRLPNVYIGGLHR